MNIERKTQVIIIGAGPTGLTLACQLFRYDIDFVILEKNTSTTPLSKAMVVHARSMEIFDEMGLAATFMQTGQITERFNVMSNGKIAERLELTEFGKDLTKFPFVLTLEQSKTEKIMVDYLTKNGIAIEWNGEFQNLGYKEGAISVIYKNNEGELKNVTGDYLVGCDGSGSLVRHQLNIPFFGNTEPKTFYVADVKIKSEVFNKKEGYINMIPDGFVLLFGMPEERHYRIIGVVSEEQENKLNLSFSDIKETIKTQLKTDFKFEDEYWFSTYKVHSRRAETFQKKRCFLAGDASHIHTPAGGQGMNTGIQDAYNLAWKLAFVIADKAKPSLLDSYNEERTANADTLLASTDRTFEFMMGPSPWINFLKLHVFPYAAKLVTDTSLGSKKFFPFISQLSIAYPKSSLTIASKIGKVRAGDRMPYFTLKDGSNIYDMLKNGSYKLLYFGEKSELVNFQDIAPNCIKLQFNKIPKIFKNYKNFYVYLRPDNHISYIGMDLEIVNRLLTE